MNKFFIAVVGAAAAAGLVAEAAPRRSNPDAKLHKYSTTVEKERPQLNEETKRLIAAYRRDPSDENRAALRKQVAHNFRTLHLLGRGLESPSIQKKLT